MNQPESFIKDRSLELFAENLARGHYPGYPTERYVATEQSINDTHLTIPPGPWDTSPGETPEWEVQVNLFWQGIEVDGIGRPLHPWAKEIVVSKAIGGLAGKGFYWNWGPNLTADPVIIRHDRESLHVLLVERSDTGELALPGGFFDPELDQDSVDTALREAWEETGLDFRNLKNKTTTVYQGPCADIRSTLHAWPETTAARLDLPTELSRTIPVEVEARNEEVNAIRFVPVGEAIGRLFGSHNLLVDLSLRRNPPKRL